MTEIDLHISDRPSKIEPFALEFALIEGECHCIINPDYNYNFILTILDFENLRSEKEREISSFYFVREKTKSDSVSYNRWL